MVLVADAAAPVTESLGAPGAVLSVRTERGSAEARLFAASAAWTMIVCGPSGSVAVSTVSGAAEMSGHGFTNV